MTTYAIIRFQTIRNKSLAAPLLLRFIISSLFSDVDESRRVYYAFGYKGTWDGCDVLNNLIVVSVDLPSRVPSISIQDT